MRLFTIAGILLLASITAACETSEANVLDSRPAIVEIADDGPRLRRVWARAEDYATPSPDGRLLTFVDWSTGDVAVHDLANSESRRITDKGSWTENGSWAEYPVFSPDGRRVVYAYGNVEAGDPFLYELRYVELGDTTQHLLRSNAAGDNWIAPLDWSERGILYTHWTAHTESSLEIIDPATGRSEVVVPNSTTGPHAFREGRFSPDSRYVAYTTDRLNVKDLETGRAAAIPFPIYSLLDWTVDGLGLLVHAAHDGQTGFWRIPVRGGEQDGAPVLVQAGIPAVEHGGARAGDAYYYKVTVDAPRLHIGSVDLAAARVVAAPTPVTTPMDGGVWFPAWSPDGRQLAYLRRSLTGQGGTAVMVRSADGDDLRQLTSVDLGRINSLAWSADGSQILLVQRSTRDLYAVSVADGAVHNVLSDFGHRIAVSSDGRTLAAIREGDQDPDFKIVVGDLHTGERRILAVLDGWQAGSLAFYDDATLAYVARAEARGPSEIRLIPIAGGDPRTLARVDYPRHFEVEDVALALSPDRGRALVQGAETWEGDHELYAVDLRTGATHPVGISRPNGDRGPFSLHPEGSRLAHVAGEARSELWALDRLDP